MAEALGMSRGDLYRYLSFSQLPDFVLQDLETSPRLLSRKSAGLLQAVLTEHGTQAIDALRRVWPQVKSGALDHSKLPDAVVGGSVKGKTVRTDRDIKKLFLGKEQAGSITRDASALTIKIRSIALTEEQEQGLRKFVEGLFAGKP